jgi:preprotein translocase subunit SecG
MKQKIQVLFVLFLILIVLFTIICIILAILLLHYKNKYRKVKLTQISNIYDDTENINEDYYDIDDNYPNNEFQMEEYVDILP